MADLQVQIVDLEPFRVACVNGFGSEPEPIAIQKMLDWAKEIGLLKDGKLHRFFGHNHPDPAPSSPNYGYDLWVTVGPEIAAKGEVEVKDFPGGRYAVTRCVGVDRIETTWGQLALWLENSRYQMGGHQWLEEHLSPLDAPLEQFMLDLYMPIRE